MTNNRVDRFDQMNVRMVFGWVFFAHQLGVALASYLGSGARDAPGN